MFVRAIQQRQAELARAKWHSCKKLWGSKSQIILLYIYGRDSLTVRGTPSCTISADADDLVMAHLAAIDASKAEITTLRHIAQE